MEYKDNGDFKISEWRSDIYTETGADYTLPDYNGDVRKILFTDASIRPSGSFEDGDNISFLGIIVYNMVYSDSENRINSVSFTSDYDLSVKCNSEKYVSSFIDTSVSSYSMRLLGPRKISAKATLSSRVAIEKEERAEVCGSAFEDGTPPEVETVKVDMASAFSSENVEREYAEELLRLDGVGSDDVEIIYSDAECSIDSVTAEENGVALKGNIRIFSLVKCEGEPIVCVEKEIRIDESIAFPKASSAMRVSPRVSVGSVRVTVRADEEGSTVVANIITDLAAEWYNNETVELVRDAYRCDAATENEYGEYKFYELSTVVSEREEFSSFAEKDTLEIENPREIICLGADAKITDIKAEENVIKIQGELYYKGIASGTDENGSPCYYPFKNTSEFTKDVNINCQNAEKIKILPSVLINNASAVLDESRVFLNCRGTVKLVVLEEKCEKILKSSEIVVGELVEEQGSRITVYYPEAGERIFDIAKKFRTTVEKINADNPESRTVSADADGNPKTKRLIIF